MDAGAGAEAYRGMVGLAAVISTHVFTGFTVAMGVEAIPGWVAAASGLAMVVASAVASLVGAVVALAGVAAAAGVAVEAAAAGVAAEAAAAGVAAGVDIVTAMTTSWQAPTCIRQASPSSDDAHA